MMTGVTKLSHIILAGLCTVLSFAASAQKIEARGGFLADSVRIGEETGFYLSMRYPSTLTVLFPDSTFAFTPFEYSRKKYFPTQSANGQSVDSAVYYLTTFEIDAIQALSLPAFVVNSKDCTIVQSNMDSIKLVQLVTHPPDSVSADKLPLKETLAYHKVLFDFNYPLLLIIGGIVLVVLIALFFIFGKRVRNYFKKKRLLKNHSRFQETYASALRQLQSSFSVPDTESTLVVWKKYMEQLESKPYTKLTTREMVLIEKDESLGKNLKAIDGVLYGHNKTVMESLESLKGFADQRFNKKLQEVNHAK